MIVADAEPLFPPTVAVIVAAPIPTPRAIPVLETVRTVESLLSHATGWLGRGLPLPFLTSAEYCIPVARPPIAAAGLTLIEATAFASEKTLRSLSHATSAQAMLGD